MSGKNSRRNRSKGKQVAQRGNQPARRDASPDNRHLRGARDGERAVLEYMEGPLPAPEVLAKYEAIQPGAADRIISMAESQSEHRQKLESVAVPAAIQAEKVGQRNGLIVALAGLGAALWLGLTGQEATASIIGGATVVGLAATFVIGRFAQARERSS